MPGRSPGSAKEEPKGSLQAWTVEVVQNGQVIRSINLVQEKSFIGRMDQNHVILDHPAVSRSHAMIQKEGEKLIIIDQGSQNGTFINGKPVLREIWKVGDLVTIEPFTLKLHKANADGPAHQREKSSPLGDLTQSSPGMKKK